MALARAAAAHAARTLQQAIATKGTARLLIGAEPGQRDLLEALAHDTAVVWGEVELFQLGERVGLDATHPASTRRFLFEHLIGPARVGRYHLLDAHHDAERACRDAGRELVVAPADVAVIGIGPAGALAGHAPPADFASEQPYFIVRAAEAECRDRNEAPANANTIEPSADAPDRAIVMGLRHLLKTTTMVATAVGGVTTETLKRCLEGSVSPLAPASILQSHGDATLYLDAELAAALSVKPEVE